MIALRSLLHLFAVQLRLPTTVTCQYETSQFYFAPVLSLLVEPLLVSLVVFPHALSFPK